MVDYITGILNTVDKIATAVDKSPEEVKLALARLSYRKQLAIAHRVGLIARLESKQKHSPNLHRGDRIAALKAELAFLIGE